MTLNVSQEQVALPCRPPTATATAELQLWGLQEIKGDSDSESDRTDISFSDVTWKSQSYSHTVINFEF